MAGLFLACAALIGGLWYVRHQWRLAHEALAADRIPEARERLAVCLRVWPRDPDVHLLAARAARLGGDAAAAEAHLDRCLQLNGGATEAVQLEFLLLRAQFGEVDRVAGPLLEKVEEGHPETPAILDTLSRVYMRAHRYRPAYACLSKWIETAPGTAKAHLFRGWVLERMNHPKTALGDYHRAMELEPDLLEARLRVVEMLLEDKQAPEALPHLERLVRQAPNDPRVRARMGMCLFLQGQSAEARRLMEAALVDLPTDPALLVALANLDLQEGKGADAEQCVRTILAADPSDTEALFILASALRLQGRIEETTAALADHARKSAASDRVNTLLKNVADSPTARAEDYAEIGRLFLEIGRDKLGVYWAERALELVPTNQSAHRALAAHYQRKGDAAGAAAHRRQILESTPPVPGSSTSKGTAP
jgi:tetratricopeptide (TPR) repeat protein